MRATLFGLLSLSWSMCHVANADIYQWVWVDPSDPALGRRESTTLVPDGAGHEAGRGQQLSGLDLTRAYMSGKDLYNIRLVGTILDNADLSNADLRRSFLAGANLSGAWLEGADIQGASFESTTDSGFTLGQLQSTKDYRDGRLEVINLSHNDMSGWDFSGQLLNAVSLTGSVLAGADLSGAQISDTDLSGVDMTGATIARVRLFAATNHGFSMSQLRSTADYQAGDLSGIRLPHNDMTGWDFSGLNMYGANIEYSTLKDADLTGADLTYASINHASFESTTDSGFTEQQLHSTSNYQSGVLEHINLSHNDFSGWDLSGIRIKSCDLRGIDLSNADLRDTDISSTDMSGADISGARIEGASIRSANDWHLTFEQIASTASYQLGDLSRVSLGWHDLSDGNFSGMRIVDAHFDNTDLSSADFRGANLAEARFEGAYLAGADFTGAEITGARFDGMKTRGFTAEQLESTVTYQSGDIRGISFIDVDLSGVDFNGMVVGPIYMRDSDLTGADFRGADVSGGHLEGSDLTGADLRGADLSNGWMAATFNGADLRGADLSGSYMRGNLKYAYFINADLRGADLSNIGGGSLTLTDADLTGADLRNADLEYARLGGTNLTGVHIEGAILRDTTRFGFTLGQLQSTASYQQGNLRGIDFSVNDLTGWDLSGQDLRGAIFKYNTLEPTILTDIDFSGADIREVVIPYGTNVGFTHEQLQSTASYQMGDLSGIWFYGNDMSGWDLSGQDLTGANLEHVVLTDTDIEGAWISGVITNWNTARGLTYEQFQSTASYQVGVLRGIEFSYENMVGWDFGGMDLSGARFNRTDLSGASLHGAKLHDTRWSKNTILDADFSHADSRGGGLSDLSEAATAHNHIYWNGRMDGLILGPNETLRIWDYQTTPEGLPIHVRDEMALDPESTLLLVFERVQWGSTLEFENGIPVTLDGVLALHVAEGVDPQALLGQELWLFDWSRVVPVGTFESVIGVPGPGMWWDTSRLYSEGVIVASSPEPGMCALWLCLMPTMMSRRTVS